EPVAAGRLKIQVAQPPAQPPPVERLAADDAGADPYEGLARVGRVGVLAVLDVEVRAVLAGRQLIPLRGGLFARLAEAAVHQVPRPLMREEVPRRIHRRPGLHDANFQPLLRKLFGGHAAGGPGAYYHRIVDFFIRHGRISLYSAPVP